MADLNPRIGTETGKVRPVLIVQTDLLNAVHPSAVICPITTNIQKESKFLRVHIKRDKAGLSESSDIMIDQLRAIDGTRLIKKLGSLTPDLISLVKSNIKIVLDLE